MFEVNPSYAYVSMDNPELFWQGDEACKIIDFLENVTGDQIVEIARLLDIPIEEVTEEELIRFQFCG